MRRFLLVFLAVWILGALVVPASASAATWKIKSPSGNRMGKVTRTAKHKATVYDRAGRRCGYVQPYPGERGVYQAAKGYDWDTGVRKIATINLSIGAWWVHSSAGGGGACADGSGRWVLVNTSTGRKYGSAARSCPGWAAAGAVFILSRYLK